MHEKLKKLLNRETLTYLFFGVLTTLVDTLVFWLTKKWLGDDDLHVQICHAIAFFTATAFAYVTNKLWVFDSRSWAWRVIRREIPAFFGGRIVSYFVSAGLLLLCTDVLRVGRYSLLGVDGIVLARLAISFFVVVLNYLFSKLLVFRRK